MPVDLTVFDKQKSIIDQQQLQDAFELKKALAIQAAQRSALETQALQAQADMGGLSAKDLLTLQMNQQNKEADRALRAETNAANQQQRQDELAARNDFRRAQLDQARELASIRNSTSASNPLPVGALKMQNDILDSFSAAKNAQDLSKSIINNIDSGALDLGPFSNLAYKSQNFAGYSTPKSQAFGSLQTSLEKLRNETLLLHKGVQTEGDAVRAMNEIISNVNDPKLLKINMEKLNSLNARAAEIQKQKLNTIRTNYGVEPYDFGQIESLNAYNNSNLNTVPPGGLPPAPGATPPAVGGNFPSNPVPAFKEGDTATNPQTGQKITFRNGRWQ